ncbi:hypothetical protein BH23BAC3_BH23BAC3_32870 [soil metagenome]
MYTLRKNSQTDSKKKYKQRLINAPIALILFIFLGLGLATNCSNPVSPFDLEQFEIDGYTWTYLGLEDKWVTAVEDTPWGLFAGTREEGVFRFDEETSRWTSLGLDHAIIAEIIFSDSSEPSILVGIDCCTSTEGGKTSAAVFTSFDQGKTWLERDGGVALEKDSLFFITSLVVDKQKPNQLFMGGSTFQLLMSENTGKNWEFVSGDKSTFGGSTEFISLSPQSDGRIWFGGQTAFFRPVIYRSDDWGPDAEPIYMPQYDGWVAKVIVDTTNPDIIWLAEPGRIAKSADAGENWETILSPAVEPSNEAVLFNGLLLDNETMFAAGARTLPQTKPHEHELRLYRSMNQGAAWDTLAVPEGAIGSIDLEFDQNMNLLIPTANGLWRVER